MADDEIKDLMRGLLLTLPDVLSNQVSSERKHGCTVRLLRTERVAQALLGKWLGSRQDNVGGGLERETRARPPAPRAHNTSRKSGLLHTWETN